MPKKERQGVVVSNKMDKTAVVKVATYDQHPKYKKIIESTKNYKAHDELNQCSEGDIVRIFKRTVDVLRQLTILPNLSEELKANAKTAITAILKEPVDVD